MKNLLKKAVLILTGILFISTLRGQIGIRVDVGNDYFAPSSFKAVVGDTIIWSWQSGGHTTTYTSIPPGAPTWDHLMDNNNVADTVFKYVIANYLGTYNYWCSIHTTMMEASFTVVPCSMTASASLSQNVSCYQGNNGSASISASSGYSPYTYLWTGGGTGSAQTALTAATYTIRVTDNAGCLQTTSITINQPATAPVISITSQVNVTCNGGTGGATANTNSGGTSPFTYSWSPSGGNALTAGSLSAGTYTITETDHNGCASSASVNITQPAALAANASRTNVSCNGGNNGSAQSAPAGGVSPYTYSWTNGATTASIGSLTTGTFTITVTDAHSCTVSASESITQPTALTINTPVATNIACFGGRGSATASAATGGTPTYNYSWTPSGGTGLTASNLTQGTYTITVTDSHSCTATATVSITQPAAALTISIVSQNNVPCRGGTGNALANAATGGTSAYTYSWSGGGGTSLSSNPLTAGTFTITAKDANSCTATASVIITQPAAALTISMNSHNDVSCYGGTGSATANSANGGTSAYTYNWAPSGGTLLNSTPIAAGTYIITVTDAHTCTASASITITQPATPLTDGSPNLNNNVSCFGGNNGSATAAAPAGGTGPYTYQWNAGGTSLSNINSALTAGTYTVTITDAHGCITIALTTVIITQPALLSASAIVTQNVASCIANNGSASSSESGGTSPYTYSWSNSQTTQNVSNLSAGTYTITVTDANSCNASAFVSLTQPSSIGITASVNPNITCFGGTNGAASSTTTGGTPPYTYSWTPSGGTNATASGLTAGTYTITAEDNSGCIAAASVIITQPAQLIVAGNQSANISCNGGNNGSETAITGGGTSPYTYLWSGGGSNALKSGLAAGTYTITVSDNHSCTASAAAIVTQPTVLTASMGAPTNVLCKGGNNGNATVTASGGTTGYTYSWVPAGGTDATGTGLSAGSYSIIVTDANGCVATASVTITEPPLLVAKMGSPTNILCYGDKTGSVSVSATGGTPAYNYSWTSQGGSNATANNLTAGIYTVTLTDANGCTATSSVIITQPVAALLVVKGFMATGPDTCTGSAWVKVSGGTGPYTYSWSPGGATADSIGGLCKGKSYCCTVTDNNNCIDSVCASIVTGINGITSISSIHIYPNPTTGQFTIQWVGTQNFVSGQWSVEVYNVLDEKVFSQAGIYNSQFIIDLSNQANGIYFIRIKDKDGSLVTERKIVKTQ